MRHDDVIGVAAGLVAHGQRQRDATLAHVELAAAAEIVLAAADVDVAVAHPGGQHLEEHLAASGLGRRPLEALERGAETCDVIADHENVLPNGPLLWRRPTTRTSHSHGCHSEKRKRRSNPEIVARLWIASLRSQ